MNNREIRKKMIDRYLHAATKMHRRDVRYWKNDPDELAMVKMFDNDLVNHKKAIAFIRTNKLKDAFEEVCNMDTAARDTVPLSVYNWLERENGIE